MRLLVTLLACFASSLFAAEEPVRLTGAFQPVADEIAARTGSVPGAIWHSRHPDGSARGRLELPLPPLPEILALNTAGYPDYSTLRLWLQSPDGNSRLKLGFRSSPGPNWTHYRWAIPTDWRGQPAVLVAIDESTEQWIGVGLVADPAPARAASRNALGSVLLATALTALPFFVALTLLRKKFGGDPPLHVTLALVSAGVFALTVFFGYFHSRGAGHALLIGGSVAAMLAMVQLWRSRPHSWSVFAPLLATLLLALTVAGTAYLYGGDQSAAEVPSGRHDLNLPSDNLIPDLFAEKIYNQQPLQPFIIDWLTSDRPPLQTGFLLQSRPLIVAPAGRAAAAMACQFAVFAGLWALLGAIGLPRRLAQLSILICATSGFFVVNTLFAWPKLLPAGFLLAATALLYRLARERRRATRVEAVALGACAALAMLGHGGSFFALLALGLVQLVFHRGWRDARLIAISATVAFCVYGPWLAYQKFADPPGDRLVKYHLANRTAIDPRGSLQVIAEAYQEASAATIIRNKLTNVRVLVGDFTKVLPALAETGREAAAAEWRRAWWRASNAIQGGAFFHLLQSLGVPVVGLLGLWWGRRLHRDWAWAGWYCVKIASVSVIAWCALMFGPEGTVVHQGSYLTGTLLLVACTLGLFTFGHPAWRWTILGLHFTLFVLIWTLSPTWNPWADVHRPTLDFFWLTTFLLAGGALLWVGWHLPVGSAKSKP